MYYKIAKYLNHKGDVELLNDFNKMVNEVVEKTRHSLLVSCFSLRNDSMLMWSHYAQSHRGACIEYEIDDEDYKKVKYSKRPYKFQLRKVLEILFGHEFSNSKMDLSDGALFFVTKPVLTKSRDWKYEKEVRCAYTLGQKHPRIHDGEDKNGNKIWLFDMPVHIKKIFLGCEADDAFVEKIEALKCGAPIVKMKKQAGKYGLLPESTK